MVDYELKLQIENLKFLVEMEEENYKTALLNQTEFVILQRLRENIKKLKGDLQVMLDKQIVNQTGELPNKNNKNKNPDK
jgi:hypothetical protein